jgi:hypothetical protein
VNPIARPAPGGLGATRLVAALVAAVVGLLLPAGTARAINAIQRENAQPGTAAWNLPGGTATDVATPSSHIQGYTSQPSVAPGDALQLHVSTTPASPYRVEIYRLGWYQGRGGRLIGCLPSCTSGHAGRSWPVPAPDPATGELAAGWPVTDATRVASTWTTGYYVAKLVLTGGPDRGQGSWVPFIVRAPAGTHSALLVQAPVNTWEAYNDWGGKSLYAFNSTGAQVPASNSVAAAMVSFNRPYANATDVFLYEYDLVRFLERKGYDVSYQTDVDTDANPGSLLGHRLDMVSGHSEYWSPAMRDAWEAARDAGVNLAFIGGNIGYWQARYQDGDRTLVEYRSAALDHTAPSPADTTVEFSAPPVDRPECTLEGIGYPGGLALTGDPVRSYAVSAAAASSPWFAATGLVPGDTLPDSVGYEWDSVQPGCATPPLTVLLHFGGLHGDPGLKGSPNSADAITYTAASGAHVFSDGSLQLVWFLDSYGHQPHADLRVQKLFTNIFDALGSAPPAVPPPAPFALRSPRRRAVLWSPRPQLRWTASTDAGAGIAGYLVAVDGRTLGFTSRTTFTPPRDLAPGRHTWRIIALDEAGGERASGTRMFTVRSVRLQPLSRAWVLAHGFTVRIDCAVRCRITARLRAGQHGGFYRLASTSRRAGLHTLRLRPAPAVTRALRQTRAHRLALLVQVRTASGAHTVTFTLRW